MTAGLSDLDLRYLDHAALALPGGGELYYEDRGEGPPLLFLNNFYIVSPVWRNFTGLLADRHRLITYDLRNQGASQPGSAAVGFDDHVADVLALLDHLGLEKAYLVSTSISTLIARDFALKYPDRVAGLVMIGPAFSPNGGFRRELISRSWLATLAAGGTKGLFDHIYPLVFPDQTVHAGGATTYLALRDNFMALLSRSSIKENLEASLQVDDDPELLSQLAVRTLVIVGDGDFAWSRSVLDDACARIPHCEGVILPRAGHVPYFEAPEAFQQAVAAFVADCAAAGGDDGDDGAVPGQPEAG
jgi:pimeloyl-ACP methyl ester carboxylesterase